MSTLPVTLCVCGQTLHTPFINQPFHRGRKVLRSFCTSPLETGLVRFSAVVTDLIARAPDVFCRKLCVYPACVTGAEEMAGIMGFIYVHTHLQCPVSGTLARGTHSSWETSPVLLHIGTVFRSRGVTQRDYSNWTSRSCTCKSPRFRQVI